MTAIVDNGLQTLLNAGAALLGINGRLDTSEGLSKGRVLQDVLQARLDAFQQVIQVDGEKDVENLELKTALSALYVLERIHAALVSSPEASLGTRDSSHLRTLLSIVFKWGTEPLLNTTLAAIPGKSTSVGVPSGTHIIDLTSSADGFGCLVSTVTRILNLVLDEQKQPPVLPTFVVATLLNRHVTDLLKPAVCVSWMPDKLKANFPPQDGDQRQRVLRLLSRLPPSQTIASLGSILSTSTSTPAYVRKTCSALLSQQLLRPRGVVGLLSAVFGEDEATATDVDAPLEKLEHVSKVLCTVPAGKDRAEYYSTIIPRILVLLTPELASRVPLSHKRAASFTLSRMLKDDTSRSILLPVLQDPFLLPSPASHEDIDEDTILDSCKSTKLPNQPLLTLSPTSALFTISTLLTNTDPSPHVISSLLVPIFPTLYSLHEYLHPARGRSKASDPVVREVVDGLMSTFAKVAEKGTVVQGLWEIIQSGIGDTADVDWQVDAVGEIRMIEATERHKPALGDVSRLLHRAKSGLSSTEDENDLDTNPLGLRPDPNIFVLFLKSIGDAEISSELFVKLLEGYRKDVMSEENEDPRWSLLKLQLILQMQEHFGDATSMSVLKRPEHVLSFIKHALGDSQPNFADRLNPVVQRSQRGMKKGDLKIVSHEEDIEEEDLLEGEDSDDEDAPGLDGVQKSDQMTVTAINLLLSILEANTTLSARTAPVLNDIYSLLEPLARSASDAIRPLAREARLVMTARLASGYDGGKGSTSTSAGEEETAEATYQRALRLLQDPILPVRAHGLLLLRELVSPHYAQKTSSTSTTAQKERQQANKPTGFSSTIQSAPVPPSRASSALIPAILSIFLEAIQDDDSYIFLNAVQGLSAMVDGWGVEVLKGVVGVYTNGLDNIGAGVSGVRSKGASRKIGTIGKEVAEIEQREVDVRLRVGEALSQVIRRCGGALGKYSDILVPPLLSTLRATHLPTALRTSSISLFAQCVDTNALALSAYTQELCEAMVDLVQVETVPTENESTKPRDRGLAATKEDTTKGSSVTSTKTLPLPTTMDALPTSTNPKFPPLRRAALHFLTLLLRSITKRVYENNNGGINEAVSLLHGGTLKRMTTVLGYVVVTDRDEVVRVMAREVLEVLEGLSLGNMLLHSN